jgi:hypothetical protein
MSEPTPRKRWFIIRHLRFPSEIGLLLSVTLVDVFLVLMLHAQDASAGGWFLQELGVAGFVGYKVVLLLVIVGLVQMTARQRPQLARILLWLAVVVMAWLAAANGIRYFEVLQNPNAMR